MGGGCMPEPRDQWLGARDMHLANLQVRDLLLPNGEWNEIFIRALIREEYAARILATRVRDMNETDVIFWPFTKDGVFTVKSGYGLIFDEYMNRKGTVRDKTRIVCVERVTAVWKLSSTCLGIVWCPLGSGRDLRLDEGQIRVINFIAILWGLWTIRNKVKFDGMTKNPHVLADLLFGSIKDKVGILKDQLEGNGMIKRLEGGVEELLDQRRMDIRTGHPVQLIGCPDRCNVIRVKVDAGWERNYVAAFGWVAYDGQGQERMRRQVKTKAETALQAEALGVRDVLLWASAEGWLHMNISSDCLQLINELAGIDKVDHLIADILEDMHKIASSFHCLCFSFIPRNLNSIAHGLARQAIKM
ncbi:uncharacterized protein LOC141597490 [Silene latifolia]|uniref:uncharacterized protein LOC141597490 n=1 Tax=Silene latifolia TaxID=37657 RepID=UPI003D77A10F